MKGNVIKKAYIDEKDNITAGIKMLNDLNEAAYRAIDSRRYKFMQFGYWAAIWVHLNRISGANRPNPFKALIKAAREIMQERYH